MPASFIQRGLSLCFSVVLTLAMLGGIDHLSSPDDGATGMARSGQVSAPRA